jgi:Galactose oxidase, central domain
MKLYSILIVMMTLIALGCSKQEKDVIGEPINASVTAGSCTGNTWAGNLAVNGGISSTHFAYNNSVYFFYKNSPVAPFENTVTIFNGSTWQTNPCAVPFQTLYAQFKFVLGNKAYVGYGPIDWIKIWEYDFAANTWTLKGDFPGGWRFNPAYFAINGKGYVVGGDSHDGYKTDIWEYDPVNNSWQNKGNHPGFGRMHATGFSIGNKGYMVNGETQSGSNVLYYNTLLQYNPVSNSWATKTPFPASARSYCGSFVISDYGYVGGGRNSEVSFIDLYKYDPVDNNWERMADIPDLGTIVAGWSINSRGHFIKIHPNPSVGYKMQKYTPRKCFASPSGSSAAYVN